MLRRTIIATSTVLLGTFGPGAIAQEATAENWFDATILEVDESDRMITVRLEANEETETYHVSEDAELIRVREHFEESMPLADLGAGDEVRLEFEDVEGRATLRKITSEMSSG